jgi:hypothetical protein
MSSGSTHYHTNRTRPRACKIEHLVGRFHMNRTNKKTLAPRSSRRELNSTEIEEIAQNANTNGQRVK